jgi:hypothetical protein
MLGCFFQLGDRTQHVAGARNMRQVNLGLDLIFAMRGSRRLRGWSGCIGVSTQMFADQFRLMLFQ